MGGWAGGKEKTSIYSYILLLRVCFIHRARSQLVRLLPICIIRETWYDCTGNAWANGPRVQIIIIIIIIMIIVYMRTLCPSVSAKYIIIIRSHTYWILYYYTGIIGIERDDANRNPGRGNQSLRPVTGFHIALDPSIGTDILPIILWSFLEAVTAAAAVEPIPIQLKRSIK